MKKTISILLIIIQLVVIFSNFNMVNANIKEGDIVTLKGDHECDSLLEYFMTKEGRWSYKIVWYVYYIDSVTQKKYPAFCVEPAKKGVGTGYDSYNTTILKETDDVIWRILSKGYMGSNWTEWNLECDDDLYSATKIALHSYKDQIAPKDKYILGNRSVDGNTVEEIQRRGSKALEVAQTLYEYGINGKETYEAPQISIQTENEYELEKIDEKEYYIQKYKVNSNKFLKSYKVSITDFPEGTKILDLNNQETSDLEKNYFKIAIPIKNIKDSVNGKIFVTDAQVKTCPIFYAKSSIDKAQSYVTYTSSYETVSSMTQLKIDPNTCNLSIIKIDAQTKDKLENVVFEVFNENDECLGIYKTNKQGTIEINNLKPGTLKIKEIETDSRYILNDEPIEVKLNWGETVTLQIENERKKGDLIIVKTDLEDKNIKLEGVEFELYNDKNELIEKLVTNKEGEATIKSIDIGEYTLKEVKTNEEYVLNSEKIDLQIEWNKETTLNIENKKIEKPKLPRTGF